MTIFVGTILSSLLSNSLLHRFGAGRVTAFSITLTALGLFGFSISSRFWMLILWSVPYGLGAGGVDAILNNYVAIHFKPQHMSWLHCMWGVGASISPYIMSFSLVSLQSWSYGYLIVSIIQIILSAVILFSIPIWNKGVESDGSDAENVKALRLTDIFKIKGAIPCFLAFFGYCSLELTTSLWASSYLVQSWEIEPETAAGLASLFYIGITLGRLANGFLAMRFGDHFLIRLGLGIIFAGITLLFIPLHPLFALLGFITVGLGCAPIYPCIIHMTPNVFGKDISQAMIGIQMAFAYTGFLIMPTFFGLIADHFSIGLLPVFQLVLFTLICTMHELIIYKKKND